MNVRVLIDTNAYAALLSGDERVALELDRAPTLRVGRRRRLKPSAIVPKLEHGARLLSFDRHFEDIDGLLRREP